MPPWLFYAIRAVVVARAGEQMSGAPACSAPLGGRYAVVGGGSERAMPAARDHGVGHIVEVTLR